MHSVKAFGMFIYLLLLHPANATLNSTLYVSGSEPQQCRNLDDCRTLQSIIYSCLSTIFLCTWVALHLNVPRDPTKVSPFRRAWFMLGALLAPELVLVFAFSDWEGGSEGLKQILGMPFLPPSLRVRLTYLQQKNIRLIVDGLRLTSNMR